MFCQNKKKIGWCSKNQNEIFTLKSTTYSNLSYIGMYLYTAFKLIFTTMHQTEKGSK